MANPRTFSSAYLSFGEFDSAAPLEFQQILAAGPAPPFLADEIGDGDFHLVEEHLIDVMVPADHHDRANGDAWGCHVNEQKADAVLLPRLVAGSDQREHAVCEVRMRCPDLGAVDDVVVAPANGACLQRGKVRSRAWFRIALAPPIFAAEDAGQVELLLLRGPEAHQDRPDHLDTHGG